MNALLTPQDWEFLSTYLDGHLSPAEQRRAQELLARRPELGTALEELRSTRAVLRAAPRRRAPRNFTLTPAMARQARPRALFHLSWAPSLTFTSALATLLLVLSFFVRLPVTNLASAPMAAPAPMLAQAPTVAAQADTISTQAEKSAGNEDGAPPIIVWNEGVRGLGAGGPSDSLIPPDQMAPMATPAEPQVGGITTDATTPAPTAAPPRAAAPLATPPAADVTGNPNGPILGVAPDDQRGQMLTAVPASRAAAPQTPVTVEPPAPQDGWRWVQWGLGLAAVLSALAAFLAWRKARP